jgi:acyl-CoA thioester hydrolase
MSQKKVAETTFYVRYAETDQMGVAHHAAYVVWFEEGRSAWMRAMGGDYAEFEAEGFYLVVSEVQARYVAPALYGRQVTVRTWVDELRSRTLKFGYEVADTESGQILVTGTTRHVCTDHQGRVNRIPAKWREMLGG